MRENLHLCIVMVGFRIGKMLLGALTSMKVVLWIKRQWMLWSLYLELVEKLVYAISSTCISKEKEPRICLAKCMFFLSRQGIALRGDGEEKDSNFIKLLLLRSIDNTTILSMLDKKTDKYTSPIIQNEMLKIMGLQVLREIAGSIQKAKYFSLMADEVTDVSNREQVAICIRWVDIDFQPHEEFIGLKKANTIAGVKLVVILKDSLLRMNLNISDCRGQCYDEAANMCGVRNGVATQNSWEESRAIFVHCYGHALYLATGDCIKRNSIPRDTLDTTFEISKLLLVEVLFLRESNQSLHQTVRDLGHCVQQRGVFE